MDLLGGRLGGRRAPPDDEFRQGQGDHGHALADLEDDLLLGEGPGGGGEGDEESEEFLEWFHLACSKMRVIPRYWPSYSFGRVAKGAAAWMARRAERSNDSTPLETSILTSEIEPFR